MFSVRLQPSRQLMLLLVAAHLAAAAIGWTLSLPGWAKLGMAAALMVSLIFHVRREAWLAAPLAIVGCTIGEAGNCLLQTKRGDQLEASLLGSSFVMPAFTVLNFKLAGRRCRRHLTILPDSLGVDEFRRLRVWLRWKVQLDATQENGSGASSV